MLFMHPFMKPFNQNLNGRTKQFPNLPPHCTIFVTSAKQGRGRRSGSQVRYRQKEAATGVQRPARNRSEHKGWGAEALPLQEVALCLNPSFGVGERENRQGENPDVCVRHEGDERACLFFL